MILVQKWTKDKTGCFDTHYTFAFFRSEMAEENEYLNTTFWEIRK